ncbi:MAG: hypothetical protein AAB728_02870, partial [Patescibacteria group bacterium]
MVGPDRLIIFAPNESALDAALRQYNGYSRIGRVDPTLSSTRILQQADYFAARRIHARGAKPPPAA